MKDEEMTVEQAFHLLEIGSSEDRLEALAIIRAKIADMREELDATIEQRDLLSQEVLRLEKDAALAAMGGEQPEAHLRKRKGESDATGTENAC